MQVIIPQPQFLKGLLTIERAINERSTLPILSNVLLETGQNELRLTATDLEVGVQWSIPLTETVEPGAIALPARRLTSIVRELPSEVLKLEAKKNHTGLLECGASRFRIPGLPPEDFPTLPPIPNEQAAAISQAQLKSVLELTAHAMSTEEARFILNGILLSVGPERLTVVATDGRRLAVSTAALETRIERAAQFVIPAKTVRELTRLLQTEEGNRVLIAPLKDQQLAFQFDGVTILSRLLEGQFPSYEKVIPAESTQKFTCDREALGSALRRVNLMTTATSQAVTFELGSGRLAISKESAELGSAHEELAASYAGEPMTIAFNPGYWLDLLKVVSWDEISVEVAGPDRPAVVRHEEFLYLVLPMKGAP